MEFKNEKLNETIKEQNEVLDKANMEKVKQLINSLTDAEKNEAIKLFDDKRLLDEFVSRFFTYKEFAIDMFSSINEMKLKVGVDK